VATPRLAREAFFSDDLPEEQLMGYWSQMQDDSFMAFLDMIVFDLPRPAKVNTPFLVLGVARDNMLRRSEIEATARAYNTQAQIIPGVAHNSMLELRWQGVAERILAWLNDEKPWKGLGMIFGTLKRKCPTKRHRWVDIGQRHNALKDYPFSTPTLNRWSTWSVAVTGDGGGLALPARTDP
jgi:hypothetical protein